jgi:hypothetical protein
MNTNTLYRAALGFVIVICATLAGAGAAAAYVGPPAADVYVRPAITAVAHPEPTPWQRVRGYCHRTHVCVRPSRTLRHQLGIRCGARAWERPENDAAGHLSTFVWARGPGGAVRTYVS